MIDNSVKQNLTYTWVWTIISDVFLSTNKSINKVGYYTSHNFKKNVKKAKNDIFEDFQDVVDQQS